MGSNRDQLKARYSCLKSTVEASTESHKKGLQLLNQIGNFMEALVEANPDTIEVTTKHLREKRNKAGLSDVKVKRDTKGTPGLSLTKK